MSTKNTYRLTLYRYKLLSVSYIAVKIVPVRYIISLIDESETRQEHTRLPSKYYEISDVSNF